MTSYTFDTNILINLERRYPRDVFETLWLRFEELIAEGRGFICEMV